MMEKYRQREGSALSAALGLLAKRSYTVKDLKQKVKRKGFSEDEIREVVAKLSEWRYLDDEDYARRYCRDKRLMYSPLKIRHELSSRGIREETVQMIMAEEYPPELERANCQKELLKALREDDLCDLDHRAIEKIWMKVYRKGYVPEVIKNVWRQVEQEQFDKNNIKSSD